jgi:hypothetical protein
MAPTKVIGASRRNIVFEGSNAIARFDATAALWTA